MITNINYAAKICRLENLTKHPEADRLQLAIVDGDTAIVDMSYKEGDLVVKFPLESTINKDFLSSQNAFDSSELNVNKEAKGYFNKHGRVRAIKLRNVFCGCYIHRLELFNDFFGTTYTEANIGEMFNKLNDVLICDKYVPVINARSTNVTTKKVKNADRIKANQFKFHWDTEHMLRNMHKIAPGDLVSVTYKVHGTSGIASNVLINRPLNIFNRILKWLGVPIDVYTYALVAASRKVIKSVGLQSTMNHSHFYGSDIWSNVAELLSPYVDKGITLYYEIVGYTPEGKYIQTNYDYGMVPPYDSWLMGVNFDVFVYRITYTTPESHVIEFSWPQIKEYCATHGAIKYVPEIDFTIVKDVEAFVGQYKSDIETNCFMCKEKVPMEGYVIRRESRGVQAFKLKSELFRLHESKELDLGLENIEN